tara:strand:- start:53 stop:187 length:135 start_codon:yes stop_codon:yes gene_type:complete
MSDNEDSTASLGNSEVLRVKHAPLKAVPELGQLTDDDSEISAVV